MSSNIDPYDLFNMKIKEFADDLVYVCPEVSDFRIFKTACEWAIGMDKKNAHGLFRICIAEPYENQITVKDETFFLQESFQEYSPYIQMYGQDMNIINKLKKIWGTLDDVNKENIWKYLQILLVLSKKCNSPNKPI